MGREAKGRARKTFFGSRLPTCLALVAKGSAQEQLEFVLVITYKLLTLLPLHVMNLLKTVLLSNCFMI